MSYLKKILLIGGGGHCLSCIDVIKSTGKYHIVGIIDNKLELKKRVCDVEIIGTDEDIPKFLSEADEFLVTIGQIKSSHLRASLFNKCINLGMLPAKVISPIAYVSEDAEVEEGTIVMHRSIINAKAHIGKNCIINSASIVEHEVSIGDHCHISTGAICNGGVEIGDGVFIGSNATLVQGIKVGQNSLVGAGSVVLRGLDSHAKVAGNPARKII